MTVEILKLNHEGLGVAKDTDGKTIFIDGVIPGEHVTYEVVRAKRRYSFAKVVAVQKTAIDRVTPKCAHFLTCGGCSNQHLATEAQISSKQQSVLELLEHFGGVVPANILPALIGPIWGYRNKARLGVRFVFKKNKVLVGFREKHSNYLAELSQCEILHPKIGTLINPLKELISSLQAYKDIAQIEVAVGDTRMALVFRNLVELELDDKEKLSAFASKHDFDLYLQPHGVDSIYKLWPAFGEDRLEYSLPDFGLNLAFHPNDFTQINPELNRKMIKQAIDVLDLNSSDRALDLFCGIGNFSLAMAKVAAHVVGVEGANIMVARAYENAKRNNISNVEFYALDLSSDQSQAEFTKINYTKVLLDPPRSGAAEILPLVANIGANMILYISCNPATLARDSGILVKEHGYRLTQVGIMDMFPHTTHVETMALFTK